MPLHPSTPEQRVTPAQVWPALSLDLRTRVIGLLAELALNVLVARPATEGARKEGGDASPTAAAQNPS
jgi:hypothetical protein